jgi:hypothetical protein
VFFDERAGITEFDGGLPRTQAEAQAFACCVTEWLNHNPVGSSPGHCLGCGRTDRPHDPLLPYGVEPTGHAWLHSRCWPAWHESRKLQAVAALANLGIAKPPDFPIAEAHEAAASEWTSRTDQGHKTVPTDLASSA